jgi:serine protease Do
MSNSVITHRTAVALLLGALMIAIIAPTTAPAEEITLTDGKSINADIIKEKENSIIVDLGFEILNIPRNQVVTIKTAKKDSADMTETQTTTQAEQAAGEMYRTTDMPLASVQENVRRFGEGVVLVSTPVGLGSGFILHPDGYLVTNYHVVEGETRLSVTIFVKSSAEYERKVFDKVRIIAVNGQTDLALLKIEESAGFKFTTVAVGDINKMKVGDRVFAVGNPLGLERTVTEGIISTMSRNLSGQLYLQTTAAINPGNSGGPLFNMRGQVIGVINMKVFYAEGMGFAIPGDILKYFLEHREAFAYDKENTNSGYHYLQPPGTNDLPGKKEN